MDLTQSLERYQKMLEELHREEERPVCRLNLSREPFGPLDSHLGGAPYCPRGGVLPVDSEGRQLWLCAQINFAQMPRMAGFPEEGILQLFLSPFDQDGGFGLYGSEDWTNQNFCRAVYYPEADGTVTWEELQAKLQVDWSLGEPWRIPAWPMKVSFTSGREGLTWNDWRFEDRMAAAVRRWFPDHDPKKDLEDTLWNACEDTGQRIFLRDSRERIEGRGCKIGGFPAFAQEAPRLYGEDRQDWDVLLFQLDELNELGKVGEDGLDLGDCGVLNLFIRPQDLERRDFSRVGWDWACS